jgi:alkylation response protein AidB-like acyl-CoA dehydrogenase
MSTNQLLKHPPLGRKDEMRGFQAAVGTTPPAERIDNSTVARLLDDIRELAPAIEARAAEIEGARRIPLDLLKTLRSIGVFRMFVPRSHGGLELDFPVALEILKALARIDGSVGWTTMIGSGTALFASLLRQDLYDEIYRDGPDVIFAGSSQPVGTAEQVAGGWRVTGRWPFASGCQHADWIGGLCIMTENGRPLPGPAEGTPLVRFFVLPKRFWQIEDTWHVAGLKGTGSHHIALSDAFVPAENLADLMSGTPCLPGPLYGAVLHVIPLLHSAVDLGMAEGALDDLVTMAQTGRRQQRTATAMRDSEIFQAELGRIEGELRAARALLEIQSASHWRHALAGTLGDEALLTQGAQAAAWIAATCVRIVDACFALGGGTAVYETSPLQRRMRDVHVGAQHAVVHPRINVSAGMLLLGNQKRSLTIGD